MIQHGVYITWENLIAQINQKQILKGVSGYCSPGSTLAIMGPSGSGKTTLLSILAKKQGPQIRIQGQVLVNNSKYNSNQFYNFASYVYQNDILNQALTVKQTLQFTAKLKLGQGSKAQQRVLELIRDLKLQKCQNVYIGGKFIKGVSGGQKKRVCIAVEMICRPDLLILDQPTSGLDSNMANHIISVLKRIAVKQGKTIIYTLHQPSFKMFRQLDRLILMKKGQFLYQGPASGILNYMNSLGVQIPSTSTVSDHFMFEISQYKAKQIKGYVSPLNSKAYYQKISMKIDKQIQQAKQLCPDGYNRINVSNSFFSQLKILLSRQIRLFSRNKTKIGRTIGTSAINIFLLGIIFLHSISTARPIQGQQNLYSSLIQYFIFSQGASFVPVASIIKTGIFSVALVFPLQRTVYSKQVASKTYNTLPYFLSKLISQVLVLMVAVFVLASGIYWFFGFTYNILQFIRYVIVLWSIALVGNSLGLWVGSLFKNAQQSSSMTPTLLMPLMMLSGIYNRLDSFSIWMSWLQYISPFRYGLHAILLNEYNNELYQTTDPNGNPITFDYKQDLRINLTYSENVGILFALAGLYYTLAFLFLKKLTSKVSA